MSWHELARLDVTLRPFDNPPPTGGTPSPFDAPLSSTLEVLRRELDALVAKRIVLQVGYRDQDLRVDGFPRANAKLLHDAVALSFDSKWGPLRYETNEFVSRGWRGGEGWQQNLRAIVLGMEALRKVDRYGVSKRGEQYTGWRAIPMSTDPADSLVTAYEAEKWLLETFDPLADAAHLGVVVKRALIATHPDRGGDPGEFRRVVKAKELLGL